MPVCCVISALAHFSVVSNGFLQFLYPSSAIDDDGRRQKRDAIQKCSDFPAQDYVDSNGCVLDKLEKSAGTIDFSKNRPTDGSSQNQQQATLSDAYIGDFELAANEFADTIALRPYPALKLFRDAMYAALKDKLPPDVWDYPTP
jgi:hypothetical protein